MSNIFQILNGTEKDLYLYDILYCVALQTIILLFSVCGPVQREEAAPPRCVLGPGTSPCCDVQWPGPPGLWTFWPDMAWIVGIHPGPLIVIWGKSKVRNDNDDFLD